LKNDFRPATGDNALVNDLKQSLNNKEDQFEQYLAENSIQTPLSHQAQKREGLRRGGRTKGETKLEKEPKKRMRLPQKGEEP
ncbi:MAG: hypothetical protein KDD34_02110, partial [Bdellovibrionales bacterium]|nr:hypothetical protein [Bdellovibrionales bacterium]